MSTPMDQTLLEMFNHLAQQQPALLPRLAQVVAVAQGVDVAEFELWRARGYAAPSPNAVKRACVLRNGLPGATWVETGTNRGDTTALLARHGRMVYSLEPAPGLFAFARQRFADDPTVEIINAPSETALPALLPRLSGDVNFWLDGHHSGGETFKGPNDTPIVEELQCIAANLSRWDKVVVMVDDVRLFNGRVYTYGPYPSRDHLVDWAREHRMTWHIEQDIFICRTV